MTAHICVLGNSHLAAVKLGWTRIGEATRGLEPTFLGCRGDWLGELSIDGNRLVASKSLAPKMALFSAGQTEIEVDAYDAFIFVGMRLRFQPIAEMYSSHRLPAHAGPKHHLISPQALRATISDTLRSSSAYNVASKLRRISTVPLFLVPEPLPSLNITGIPRLAASWTDKCLPDLYDVYVQALSSLAADFRAELVMQPAHTVVDACFTQHCYCEGSTRLDCNTKHPKGDQFHMNEEYGGEVLNDLLPRVVGRLEAVTCEPVSG